MYAFIYEKQNMCSKKWNFCLVKVQMFYVLRNKAVG